MALLLSHYNGSMQLGQGFNSFLHKPCIDVAVKVPEDAAKALTEARGGAVAANVSQIVSYSSRCVDRISDVVRSMNLSAAAAIKSGKVEVSGNSASDVNAVISVKVVNQTISTIKDPQFCPLRNDKGDEVQLTSQRFFEIYGDCYISGFMEGGDLHGIINVKALNASKKSEIQSSPDDYTVSSSNTSVPVTVEDLVNERKLIKKEMVKIGEIVDTLNNNPSQDLESQIEALKSPEIWATRLPVLKDNSALSGLGLLAGSSAHNAMARMTDLPWAADPNGATPTNPGQPAPTTSGRRELPPPVDLVPDMEQLAGGEYAWAGQYANKIVYGTYRFGQPAGCFANRFNGLPFFNHVERLQKAMSAVAWPRRLTFYGHPSKDEPDIQFSGVIVDYDQMKLLPNESNNPGPGSNAVQTVVNLEPNEKVNLLRVGTRKKDINQPRVYIYYVEVNTTPDKKYILGQDLDCSISEQRPWDGRVGLKGFWGSQVNGTVVRLGAIWG